MEPILTQYSDYCFACMRVTMPDRIIHGVPGAVRSFHTCEVEHFSVTHADWWTDWLGGEVVERIQIFDPALGDGGTTWSGAPLPPYPAPVSTQQQLWESVQPQQ